MEEEIADENTYLLVLHLSEVTAVSSETIFMHQAKSTEATTANKIRSWLLGQLQ